MKTVRNVAIMVIIAAAVYFVPGGGRAAGTFEAVAVVRVRRGMAYLGLRMYREHRVSLHGLGDRHRALLYGGALLAVFVFVARTRMWTELAGRAGLVPADPRRDLRGAGGLPPLAQLLTRALPGAASARPARLLSSL